MRNFRFVSVEKLLAQPWSNGMKTIRLRPERNQISIRRNQKVLRKSGRKKFAKRCKHISRGCEHESAYVNRKMIEVITREKWHKTRPSITAPSRKFGIAGGPTSSLVNGYFEPKKRQRRQQRKSKNFIEHDRWKSYFVMKTFAFLGREQKLSRGEKSSRSSVIIERKQQSLNIFCLYQIKLYTFLTI